MKSENSTSRDLNVKLLTDTSPSICDPALHRIDRHGRSVLETLNGAINMLNGPDQEKISPGTATSDTKRA